MATANGTWGYRDRFGDSFGRTYFRRFGPGVVSSIGIGTYLGAPTDAVDDAYHDSLVEAFESGVNLVDTAINYRCQRSERVVGRAFGDADIDREELVVATKGGFLPFDGERPSDPSAYVREQFVDTGLVDADDLARGSHCMTPDFLDAMLDRSLDNLRMDTIDCYYVHNPETQLAKRDAESVYDQLEAAFERLEKRRNAGDIGGYGIATWEAFRVPPEHPSYLSLAEVVSRADRAAETVGNEASGLIALQLPFNVEMADAFTAKVHERPVNHGSENDEHRSDERDEDDEDDSERVSALEFAHESGLSVFASASLKQGDLVAGLPEAVAAELEGDSPSQQALNFARSAPAVTAALVGTKSREHVAENVAAGTFDPLGAKAFDGVFE
ncbi:oxidoreductase [Haloprofundus marisrubri]|uniref:Oxidoreductase n=1 Tax=Haloprofundus marisrubri TaxID=1514971 RepID=A0A0W1R8I7_9EURY|nr:aldo/keto reductase [Haloprofundus marisrubri]KTG09707.1 oxidoreductase [Haloprofundus marisrubri]